MSLTGCGMNTKTTQHQKLSNPTFIVNKITDGSDKQDYLEIKKIDLSKYYMKPIKDLRFNTKKEIVESTRTLLDANAECRSKLNKLKKEVSEYDKSVDNLLQRQSK